MSGAEQGLCYVALGDSFSAGVVGDRPWPDLAAERLERDAPGLRFRNFAGVGVTSETVAGDQLEPALELEPTLVSLICGANDVLASVRPDETAFRRCFESMLARIAEAAPGAIVVTATYPTTAPGWLGPRTRRRVVEGLVRFNEVLLELSESYGALCLDWQHTDQAELDCNRGEDGFHPSPEGHRIAAADFVASVTPLLARQTNAEVR